MSQVANCLPRPIDSFRHKTKFFVEKSTTNLLKFLSNANAGDAVIVTADTQLDKLFFKTAINEIGKLCGNLDLIITELNNTSERKVPATDAIALIESRLFARIRIDIFKGSVSMQNFIGLFTDINKKKYLHNGKQYPLDEYISDGLYEPDSIFVRFIAKDDLTDDDKNNIRACVNAMLDLFRTFVKETLKIRPPKVDFKMFSLKAGSKTLIPRRNVYDFLSFHYIDEKMAELRTYGSNRRDFAKKM
jgi:hypothetical protein